MSIVLKHIIRNVLEKKLRSILIILSIAFSVMILVLNLQVSKNIEDTSKEFSKRSTGFSDITITTGSQSRSLYFNSSDINWNNTEVTKKLEFLRVVGKAETEKKALIRANIIGLNIEKAKDFGFVQMLIEENSAGGAIISVKTSEESGLKIGDEFSYTIKGKTFHTKISGIAMRSGVFFEELGIITVLEDLATINKKLNQDNKINTVYLNSSSIDSTLATLTKNNPELLVTEGHNADTEYLRIGLLISMSIIMIMSIYIITSLSKLLLAERIPVVGTFLSAGADKKKIYLILLGESILYGLLGAIIGVALSFLSVKFIGELFNEYGKYGIHPPVYILDEYLITAVIFAIVLSMLITLSSIFKLNRTSLKDSILNTIDTEAKVSNYHIIVGEVLLILSVVTFFINTGSSFVLGGLSIIFLIMGFVLIMPKVIDMFSRVFQFINERLFGSEAALAAKNLRNNIIIIGNIRIVTIVMALLIGVFTIIISIQENGDNLRNGQNYDFQVANLDKDLSKYDSLYKLNNIDNIFVNYEKFTKFTSNNKGLTFMLQAVDEKENIKRFEPGIVYDSSILEHLYNGKNILIDEYRAKLYGIKLGDVFILDDNSSLNKGAKYTVIGFLDCKGFTADRSVALISVPNYKNDISGVPDKLLVKIKGNIEAVRNILINTLIDTESSIYTKEESLMESYKLVGKAIMVVEIVLLLGIIMGLFGMTNNQFVGFLQRKRELAVLYSVGMNISKLTKMLLFETLSVFGTAIILGAILGLVMIQILPKLLGAVGLAIDFSVPIGFLVVVISGIFIILFVTAIFPIKKITKINVVEELKYE